jgi:hypothetical protein
MIIDDYSLILGLLLGSLLTLIAGAILGKINTARNVMRSPDKPMSVSTSKTPREVFGAAAEASRTCFVMSVVFVIFLVISAVILYSLLFMI